MALMTLLANLKKAVRDRESVTVGGGEFSSDELKDAVDAIEQLMSVAAKITVAQPENAPVSYYVWSDGSCDNVTQDAAEALRWCEEFRASGAEDVYIADGHNSVVSEAGLWRSLQNPLWLRDDIQFPRLLCEISATQDLLDLQALAESMDLTIDEVGSLFDRANDKWEAHKRKLCPFGSEGLDAEMG